MSDRKQIGRGFGGKGYYIALILCAAAIGISGYLYYRNTEKEEDRLSVPPVTAVQETAAQNVPAVATQPEKQVPAPKPSQSAAEPSAAPEKKLRTGYPVEGETVAAYAMDTLGYNETTRDWRVHNGIDIAAEEGTPVCAAADGTVYTTYEDDTMGMTVVIRHEGGYVTKYASLGSELSVSAGDKVELGQQIGVVGRTALLESALSPHVHFGVTCHDAAMDPLEFLNLG